MRRKTELDLRGEMVEVCRLMYERGYISGLDGNASVRLDRRRLLTTPSGAAKGRLKPEALVVTDLVGKPLKGQAKPSSELKVHLAVYRLRPEVSAVVHAHPPASVAHSIAGISLAKCIVPETILTVGHISTATYATPGSRELAGNLEEHIRCFDAIIMDRHGTVTMGSDLFEAYQRLETVEHTAQISLMARSLGPVRPLPKEEVEKLYTLAESAGVSWPFLSCDGCDICPDGTEESTDALVAAITQRVLKIIGEQQTSIA